MRLLVLSHKNYIWLTGVFIKTIVSNVSICSASHFVVHRQHKEYKVVEEKRQYQARLGTEAETVQ